MNKSKLIVSMATKSNLSKMSSEKALNAFIDIVETTLSNGEKISLIDFGSFEATKRASRSGIHSKTKESVIYSWKNSSNFQSW